MENIKTIVKRGRGRPRKLENLTQINGKIETQKDISQFSTLDECMGGINPLSAYGSIDATSYEAKLRDMTNSELEAHAREKGVMFTLSAKDPYNRLRGLLLKEFQAYVASLNRPTHRPSSVIVSAQTQKILNEGKNLGDRGVN